ncbi:class I SAM-dependent methyltransferase [Streptomyces sp. NPDC052013]|uniref:class I SAM-dependent methyltransferase n=1 Tax=Streptomyces sp. NPDC052013 TaxID=3365679 RepID=UPI0037D5EA4D
MTIRARLRAPPAALPSGHFAYLPVPDLEEPDINEPNSVLETLRDGDPKRAWARRWFEDPSLLRVSRRYDDRETGLSRALCAEVGLVLGERAPARVLDAGCGTGATLAHLRAHLPGADLVGIDPSEAAVRSARLLLGPGPGTQVHTMAAEDLAGPAGDRLGRFDLALVHLSLGLMRDPFTAVCALARVLNAGGHCYIVDLLRPDDWDGESVPAALGAKDAPERAYLRSQLAASLSMSELRAVGAEVERLVPGVRAEVRRGGLCGHHPSSEAARRIWLRAPRIGGLLASAGARPGAGEQMRTVAHMVIRRDGSTR